jgi:hypothetical protein
VLTEDTRQNGNGGCPPAAFAECDGMPSIDTRQNDHLPSGFLCLVSTLGKSLFCLVPLFCRVLRGLTLGKHALCLVSDD